MSLPWDSPAYESGPESRPVPPEEYAEYVQPVDDDPYPPSGIAIGAQYIDLDSPTWPPPEAYVPEDELPYRPKHALSDEIVAVVQETLKDAMPAIQEQMVGYVKQTVYTTLQGKEIDHRNPTITGTTSKGRELKVADAKSRSFRTLLQGLTIDCVFALIALAGTLTNFDPLDKASWSILIVLVIKTLLQTATSFLMRMKITPTVRVKDEAGEKEKMKLLPLAVPIPRKPDADLQHAA